MFFSKGFLSFCGSAYLKKYHEEQANPSCVSVSLFAFPPHLGQVVFTKSLFFDKGDSPVPVGSKLSTSGSKTGRDSSETGTTPHFSQWMIGIGAPQYL